MRVALSLVVALHLLSPNAASAQDDEEETAEPSGGSGGTRAHARWSIDEPHSGRRPFQLDVHGGFTWWGLGAATGVRFGIPLVENGFIDSLNNAVYLNFGLDFYWVRWRCNAPMPAGSCDWQYNAGVGIPVTLHWEFYFDRTWSAFAEVGAQIFIHPAWISDGNFAWREPGQWFVWTIGVSMHINEWFGLTLRVGSPYIAFGITFQI